MKHRNHSKKQDISEKLEGNTVIKVDNVNMEFTAYNEKINSIKEFFIKTVQKKIEKNKFIALKDISFEVKKGERLGILGLNGAGKSTLLTIISGIIKPTKGSVTKKGSVSSLLELNVGFDSEYTGYENVFLYGALLGHSKKFIEDKMDEIIEFSELQGFMDTPVKNFSSGMVIRLGFSVATLVEPEILILDEVLSVGDARFKEKSRERIMSLFNKGITVLFVSHSLDEVRKMCNKAIWLEKGTIRMKGDSEEVCNAYDEFIIGENKLSDIIEKLSIEKQKVINQNYIALKASKLIKEPMVSILILNRNGIEHLERLFIDFEKNLIYKNYEIIVVDNGSTDKSLIFLEKISKGLPLTIIKNKENKSFSEGNNQAAELAKGDYLLLLNNSVEPTYAWLNEMMGVMLNNENVGSVGAKLVYPIDRNDESKSLKTQYLRLCFRNEREMGGDTFYPYPLVNLKPPYHKSIKTRSVAGLTTTTLLIKKSVYESVNGLDNEYNSGFEDVDLALKLLKKGFKNIFCSSALLFHYESPKQLVDNQERNTNILNKKWAEYLFENIFKDKLNNVKFFTEEPLKISLIISTFKPNSNEEDTFIALELSKELENLGYDVNLISKDDKIEDSNVDVLINLLYDFDISKLNKNIIKIAWMRNYFTEWINNPNINQYDFYLAPSKTACENVSNKLKKNVHEFPLATNPDRFKSYDVYAEYESDYSFIGNYLETPIDIIKFLDPKDLNYNFSIYGENNISKFEKYNKGFINYLEIPKVYSSTKLIIDDTEYKSWGYLNSTIFDAIASKKIVITNSEIGSKEIFDGTLPSYSSKEELYDLINLYLKDENKRNEKIDELYKYVLNNHTYKNRALELKEILNK
jgi:ABC-type polysaccharide/polyol phosphate transport system ATPase subunit/GT2 family glycosyltransferase